MLLKKMDKIRYAVVGLGYIAQTAVLPAFRNARKNSRLVALVSGDKEKLKKIGEKYKIERRYLYSEFEELMRSGEVDAVYIATPNFYHRNIMESAARHGVHVLCEKPMAVTAEDCYSMMAEAEKYNVQLMVAYRLHFEAANLEAITRAQAKRIGDLKVFHSVFTLPVKDPGNVRLETVERGGGPLYDIGVYCINASRYLFKDEPVEVFATATSSKDSRFRRNDETISCILKYPGGRLASFTVSFGAFATNDYDLIGTKGRIRLEKAYAHSGTMVLKTYEAGKTFIKRYPKRDQFAPELIYFSDCIQRRKKVEPSGEEGLLDVKIIEALLLSIDLGSPIALDEIHKRSRPGENQKITRPSFLRPKLINAHGPGGARH